MKNINLALSILTGITGLVLFPSLALAQTAGSDTTVAQPTASRSATGVGRLADKLEIRMGKISESDLKRLLGTKSSSTGQAGGRNAPTQKQGDSTLTSSDSRTYGTANLHFTHARVANRTTGPSNQPVSGFPYVASGRLLMGFGTTETYTSTCSASLIGKGVIVTAAHCIADFGGGTASLAKHVRFIPANNGGTTTSGPYGSWYWARLRVPTAYLNGTDPDTGTGVVTNNDVAVIELEKRNSLGQLIYPYGIAQIYYYGYGWNYNASNVTPNGLQEMTSLGYPGNYDSGQQMQRFDSLATPTGSGADGNPFQWIRGGNMAPGSSGGPWLVNFGTVPSQTGGTLGPGGRNYVVGVTSWWTGDAVKRNGASRFGQNPQFPNASYTFNGINYGAGNIGALMRALCGTDGAQTRGACF
uniref:Peptidase S1 and S6 chymotrypsin/Hap n=1 Tax=Cyanothece sp. (strain PCC 7425 / ATCC 29141) TaxID=395961 RepID=B8HRX6_CYAP4